MSQIHATILLLLLSPNSMGQMFIVIARGGERGGEPAIDASAVATVSA